MEKIRAISVVDSDEPALHWDVNDKTSWASFFEFIRTKNAANTELTLSISEFTPAEWEAIQLASKQYNESGDAAHQTEVRN